MEEGEYILGKAKEETGKLRKKVEFGDAPNYGEAEKVVKQETKKKRSSCFTTWAKSK